MVQIRFRHIRYSQLPATLVLAFPLNILPDNCVKKMAKPSVFHGEVDPF